MMKFSTAVTRILTVGVLVALAGSAAAQQAYPSKPLHFITPFAPGGSTTVLARIIGQKLTDSWGQQVLVENRPGGNTIIGTEALAKSPPDGYTIMLTSNTHVIIPHLLPLPYDTIKDFAPVATLSINQLILVVHPSIPANNLREFISLAKSKPGQLNYSSSGTGSANHLIGELLAIVAGVKLQHVPYKGGGSAIIDLIGGQVQLSFQPLIVIIPYIKSGKVRAVAITGVVRSPALSQVPTFSEAGLAGTDVNVWYGVLAPAGTPKPIIDRLSTEIARILAMPDIKEKLDSQGVEPFFSTPEQFAALIKADMSKFAKIIKTANIKLEN